MVKFVQEIHIGIMIFKIVKKYSVQGRSNLLRRSVCAFLAILLVATNSIPAAAFSDFYSDSNIQFYDPNACNPSGDVDAEDSSAGNGTGKWSLASGANAPGKDQTPLFKKFLDELSKHTSFEPIVTTGTNHSSGTASGNTSEHPPGNAADFGSVANKFGTSNAQAGRSVPRGDEIAAAALIAGGMSTSQAKSKAKQGGLINHIGKFDGKNVRVQVIWKVDGAQNGGNHRDHVHVGLKALSSSFVPKLDILAFVSSIFFGSTAKAATDDTSSVEYVAKGNIPKSGKKYVASVYGTTGKKDSSGKYVESLSGMEGGANDEKGKALKGRVVVAEMAGNTALGSLPYGSKIEITYKGKSVVAEVSDNGPGAGEHSDVDLWRQTADLLDFPYGKEEVTIRGVANSTPTTPVDGEASSTESETNNVCCPANSGASVSGTVSSRVGHGASSEGKKSLQEAVVAAGTKHDVDPNFVAAFYYSENARTGDSTNNADSASGTPATGDGKWRDPAPPYGKGASWPSMNAYSAYGPFQFITSTWQAYKPKGANDTSDRLDLKKSAMAAAKYLAASGGKKGASTEKLRQAAFAYNHSNTYVQSVMNTYKYLSKSGDTSIDSTGSGGAVGCPTGSGDGGEVIDGFAFPVGSLKKSEVGTNNGMPCRNLSKGCHHDGTSAFDIGKGVGSSGILGQHSKGLPVYAIEDGKITNYNQTYMGISGCPTYQLKGESGWVYWYGHTTGTNIRVGSKVKAGQKIAEIGPSKCTGNGSMPHLHIDRGTPKGANGGSMGSRDPSLNEVINNLWEALPN